MRCLPLRPLNIEAIQGIQIPLPTLLAENLIEKG